MKLGFSRQTSRKYSNIKFHENPSSGIQAVLRGRTNLIVVFRNWRTRLIKTNTEEFTS